MLTLDSLPSNIVFGTSGVNEVIQNVRTIITTPKGTLPLDRGFGISIQFLDSPITTARAKAEQEIFMQVKKYEPRAVIKQIIWANDPISGSLKPNVVLEVVK